MVAPHTGGRRGSLSPSGRLRCGFKWACRNPSPHEPRDVIEPRGALFRGEPAERAYFGHRSAHSTAARPPPNHARDSGRAACLHCRPSAIGKNKDVEKRKKNLAFSWAASFWLGSLAVLPSLELDQTKPRKERLAVAAHVATYMPSKIIKKNKIKIVNKPKLLEVQNRCQ